MLAFSSFTSFVPLWLLIGGMITGSCAGVVVRDGVWSACGGLCGGVGGALRLCLLSFVGCWAAIVRVHVRLFLPFVFFFLV